MKMHAVLVGLMAFPLSGPAVAQTIDVSALASACSICHGKNAEGSDAIPGLRGQQQAYLAEQLRAFKSGARPATVMTRFAKGYTDEEIAGLALYFSRLK